MSLSSEGFALTGEEIVKLIRYLRKRGVSDSKILNVIIYMELHASEEDDECACTDEFLD